MPITRTNKRRALSLQEVELYGWFLIFHIVLEICIILFIHKFNMSFVSHFCILGLTSWIWTNLSTEGLKFESPWNETHIKASILTIGWRFHFDLPTLTHMGPGLGCKWEKGWSDDTLARALGPGTWQIWTPPSAIRHHHMAVGEWPRFRWLVASGPGPAHDLAPLPPPRQAPPFICKG